jgi:hypothetical protein
MYRKRILYFIFFFNFISFCAISQDSCFKGMKLLLYYYNDTIMNSSQNIEILVDKNACITYIKSIYPIKNWFTISTAIQVKGKLSNKEFEVLIEKLKGFRPINGDSTMILIGINSLCNYYELLINNEIIKYECYPYNYFPQDILRYLLSLNSNPELQKKSFKYKKRIKNYWRMIYPMRNIAI